MVMSQKQQFPVVQVRYMLEIGTESSKYQKLPLIHDFGLQEQHEDFAS